jgi:hypothetical protein
MAGEVGQSTGKLADGMYLIESAGYHGADGLAVLKAAAEGAKVGNADLKTVSDGLTTAMTDYQTPTKDAAKVTSQLIAAVGAGKTTVGDLSNALSTVLPGAAKAGIGLDQVLGAMSTMTAQGVSADQAAQNLSSTIAALQNPSDVASKAMGQMGLNSITVAQQLGQKGLTGTLSDMAKAVMDHMGPAGLVLQSSMNESTLAAQSAQKMLEQLPSSIQKSAKGFMDGTVTAKDWAAVLADQPAKVSSLGQQFATTTIQANGFSDQLKSGKGDAATFNAMMSDMTGGQSGLNTSLALTGANLATFQSNVATVGGATADAKGSVKGWDEVNKDFATRMDKLKDGTESFAIKIGTALIPKVESLVNGITKVVGWFEKHRGVTVTLAIAAGVLGAAFVIGTAAIAAHNVVVGISAVLAGEATAATVAQYVALGVQRVAVGVAAAAQWAWNAALSANPIGIIVGLIVAFAAAVVFLFNHNKTFHDFIMKSWAMIKAAVAVVVDWFKTSFVPFMKAVWAGVMYDVNLVKPVFMAVWNGIKTAIKAVADWISGTLWPFLQLVWAGVMYDVNLVKPVFMAVWNGIKTAIEAVSGWISGTLWPVLQGAWTGIMMDVTAVKTVFLTVWNGIREGVSAVWDFLKGLFAWSPLGMIIDNWGAIVGFFRGLPSQIASAATGMWDGLVGAFKSAINTLIRLWNNFSITLGGGNVLGMDIPSVTLNTPDIPYLANGTGNFAGGFAVVGERGPEVATLPAGAQVTPNSGAATVRLLADTIRELAGAILDGAGSVVGGAFSLSQAAGQNLARRDQLRAIGSGVL